MSLPVLVLSLHVIIILVFTVSFSLSVSLSIHFCICYWSPQSRLRQLEKHRKLCGETETFKETRGTRETVETTAQLSIGVANKTPYLWHSWALPIDSKHSEGSLSPISTDSSYFRVAQLPRCGDRAIFVTTGGQNRLLIPCACARGNQVRA